MKASRARWSLGLELELAALAAALAGCSPVHPALVVGSPSARGTCEGADTDTDPNLRRVRRSLRASHAGRDSDLKLGLLASDTTNVYWASATSSWVKRLRSASGAPDVIYGGDPNTRASAMAARAEPVYLAVIDPAFHGSVLRIPSDGSGSTTLVAGPSAPILELAVDANKR